MQAFLVLLLAYTLSQFYRSFFAVIAPEIGRQLSLGSGDLGNISSAWFTGFALAQLYVGWSLDRLGPRRTLSLMMLVAVAGAGVFSQASDRWHCLAGMFLIGVGCAPIYMSSLYFFARTYDTGRFALLSSWLLGIGTAGNLLAATPLAAASQLFGWRLSFVAIAGLTAVSALLVGLLLRDPERVESPDGGGRVVTGPIEILGIRGIAWFLPITLFSYAVILAERGLWVGPFLAEVHGLGPIDRGNAVVLMALAMSAGAIAYGPLDKLIGRRKPVVAAGSLATALLFVALALWPGQTPLMAAVLLALIGAAGMTYVILIAHARQFFPEHLLGRGMTTMNVLYFGGAAILQPLSGAWVDDMRARGLPPADIYANLHLAFGVILLVSTGLYLLTREHPR